MPSAFPGGQDSWSSKVDAVDTVFAADVNNLQNAVASLEIGGVSVQNIAYAATIAPDVSAGGYVIVGTLTGNITINAPANPLTGRRLAFRFTQDGTGGRTVTWNAVFKVTNWTVNTAASAQTEASFTYDGTNWVLASNPPTAPNGLALGKGGLTYDFYAYAGVGDEVADDTTALQNTINAVPSPGPGQGLVASEVSVRRAGIKLTATVNVVGRSIIFRGSGIGNPSDSATPGRGTTFSWQGAAGLPMFSVSDCEIVIFEDCYFEGNGTNVPSDLVFFDGTAQSHGANHRFYFRRCRFGGFSFSTRAPHGTLSATNGVRYGGANTDNDQFHYEDCIWDSCGTGFNTPNSQSIWGLLDHCTFDTCTTAGVSTAASMKLVHPMFNACAIDIKVTGKAQVDVFGWDSENSFQLGNLGSDGCSLCVTGGKITSSANMGINWFDHESCGNGGRLSLDRVYFDLAGQGHKKIKVRGLAAGAGLLGEVDIRGCGAAIALADLDIANVVSGDDLWVTIDSNAIFLKQKLRGGGFHDVLSTTAQQMQIQGALQRSTQTTTPTGASVTYTPDATLGEVQEIIQGTTAQTLTIASPANRLAGQFHTFKFVHFADASTWALTFNAVFKRAGGAFANTNTTGAVDTITFYDDGTNLREVGRAINLS